MFAILLHYVAPLEAVDRLVPEHIAYLDRHYASGHFLMSGRKAPRTGGVILAQAASKAEIESIICEDPFHREQVAEYEIVEFLPSKAAPPYAQILNIS